MRHIVAGTLLLTSTVALGQELTPETARRTTLRACDFFHSLAKHGGYVWRYSKDKKLSEGEAETDADTVWVQPPGTPTIGNAFLDAYEVTNEPRLLEYANEAATTLAKGQLQSGGWYYSIHFAEVERSKRGYRDGRPRKPPRNNRRDKFNITTLDDDTTQAALRFLIRLDQFNEPRRYEDTIRFGLKAILDAQAPNGGWRQNWDRYPQPLPVKSFPVTNATSPRKWPRRWDNKWTGKYYLNDNVIGTVITTLLDAWQAYDDEQYLTSAKRGGEFLILAQMPDPQPAWAQQYDENMHPVWDRRFEPPAISGMESRFAIEALLELATRTGDKKFLKPIPRALTYLQESEIEPGRLARFYELGTNKPLYFDRKYNLTYSDENLPTHYSFKIISKLNSLKTQLRDARSGQSPHSEPSAARTERAARRYVNELNAEGGWLDPRGMRGFGKVSREGIYQSETFADRIRTICEYLRFKRGH